MCYFNFLAAKMTFKGEDISIRKSKIHGNITLNRNVKIYDTVLSGNIEIGRYSSISGPFTTILTSRTGKVTLGSFCSIARGVQIQEYNHKFQRASSYYFGQNIFKKDQCSDIETKGDIEISDDVWIGANAIILSGVKIGRGSIIAAGSVVNKNVPPYSIFGGVPAKLIKYRFCQDNIFYLEKSEWWLWPIEKIVENEKFFMKYIG